MSSPPAPPRISFSLLAGLCVLGTVVTSSSRLLNALPLLTSALPPAVALTVPFALGAWAIGGVSTSGAVAGALVSVSLYAGSAWSGWLLLVGVFAITHGTTRLGRARKLAAGIAESRRGRRAIGNVVANTGVAAAAALFIPGTTEGLAGVVVAAALITAAADSAASEVGKAYGRRTYLVPTGRRVPPGTNGAVSFAGTAAGAAAALLLACVGAWSGLIPATLIGVVAAAAVIASLLEGALGTCLEDPGWLDNDGVNFLNTLVGSALAAGAGRILGLA